MKKLLFILIILSGTLVNSQVTVTTVSPEIKGSGGLSLDGNGNLIIADFGDFLSVPDPDGQPNDIHIMDLSTNIITNYSTGFEGASGNDFDSNGVLFQSDIRDSGIYKIVGGVRTFVTNNGIVAPVGIAFDSNDNFFVCNCGNNTIRKVTPGGVSTAFASGAIFQCPNGITVDEDDNLYVSNFSNGSVIKITPAGVATVILSTPAGSTGGPSNGHLEYHQPTRTLFIASHGSNTIYAARLDKPCRFNHYCREWRQRKCRWGWNCGQFSRPNGVTISDDGDTIYVNSAVPVTNVPNGPLNPQLIRMITGVQSVLGIHDETKNENTAFIYPNPVSDLLTIEANLNNHTEGISVEFFDIHGRLLKSVEDLKSDGFKLKVQVSMIEFQSGTYFYTVSQDTIQIFNGKSD